MRTKQHLAGWLTAEIRQLLVEAALLKIKVHIALLQTRQTACLLVLGILLIALIKWYTPLI